MLILDAESELPWIALIVIRESLAKASAPNDMISSAEVVPTVIEIVEGSFPSSAVEVLKFTLKPTGAADATTLKPRHIATHRINDNILLNLLFMMIPFLYQENLVSLTQAFMILDASFISSSSELSTSDTILVMSSISVLLTHAFMTPEASYIVI